MTISYGIQLCQVMSFSWCRRGIDPNAQAAHVLPIMHQDGTQSKAKKFSKVIMKYADLCMPVMTRKSRGDIDIQQYHDDPGKLAEASMLKMLHRFIKNAPFE